MFILIAGADKSDMYIKYPFSCLFLTLTVSLICVHKGIIFAILQDELLMNFNRLCWVTLKEMSSGVVDTHLYDIVTSVTRR